MGLAPLSIRCGAPIRTLSALGSGFALAAAWAWAFDQRIWSPGLTPASVAALVTSAASAFLMGSVSLAMLLGHAYLTHTEMTIQPLRRLARLFAAGMIARALLAAGSAALCLYLVRTGRLNADLFRDQRLCE
jgi:hypothetical protein